MSDLIDIKDVDRTFYSQRLESFLPDKIIDIHSHVWTTDRAQGQSEVSRCVSWPARVAKDNSVEDLIETYKLMLPGKQVTPLIFAIVLDRSVITQLNAYTADCAAKYHLPSLLVTMPEWTPQEFESNIQSKGFIGSKVYLSYAPPYIPANEIRIFDSISHHQLEVLDRHGWILMLHIPRPGRLADPVNLAQMLEIENRYPNIKLVIAHVGRAYTQEDVGDAFSVLAPTKNMYFDFSANTNADVFRMLIDTVGPKRILFGTDMPILRMRMRRITRDGHYVNMVPKGLYGDVSDDPNMGELEGEEADKLTFFLYEEIDAFRRAAEASSLTASDIEDVFYNNARNIITSATSG